METIIKYKNMVCIMVVLSAGTFVWKINAGDLNPPGEPTGTMRTLNEIYSAAFEPVSVPITPEIGDLYLLVDGIDGECRDEGHVDWIQPLGYTFHVENGASPKGNPCPKFSNLLVAKNTDLSSGPLKLKCCNNQRIAQVVLERANRGPEGIVFYRLTLTYPRVTYISPNSAHTTGYEVVSFGGFEHVKWEYRPLNVGGEPGKWQVAEWDIIMDGGES